jgi:hypothetical protein
MLRAFAAALCSSPRRRLGKKPVAASSHQNSFGPLNLKRLKEFFLVLVAVAFSVQLASCLAQ